ncbi:DUF1232 domain-containing protein [Sulfuriroseicoccus oceanibius]|uniref:DUF1232 domain-containing protein n=1 Tax=Sulfuriroseicoccus oceanibius TaxID=2707525 RepID=A0A6B3L1K6_9BACT|nr:DUF1232 domain-containing protein [Sulfuriroseicoccus oceanibius]QQL44385.1 DUF1232 domain-containing protein [Sulfuriroseicoccus oceanibius]
MANQKSAPEDNPTGCLGKIFALIGAAISGLYLLNPTLGWVELIPDNIPGVGNLDEAFFTGLLILSLAKLGVRLPWLNRNRPPSKETPVTVDEDK